MQKSICQANFQYIIYALYNVGVSYEIKDTRYIKTKR